MKEKEEREISVRLMNHASGDYTLAVSVSSGPRKLLLLIVSRSAIDREFLRTVNVIDRHCRL